MIKKTEEELLIELHEKNNSLNELSNKHEVKQDRHELVIAGKKSDKTLFYLFTFYALFSVVVVIIGIRYYNSYESNFRNEIEKQLSAITQLKVQSLVDWRNDGLKNANIFYNNEAFREFILRYFKNPNDLEAKNTIQTWLENVKTGYDYDAIFISDTNHTKRILISERIERQKTFIQPNNYDSLKLGKIVFEDFYRDENIQKIFLNILVPIIDGKNNNQLIAILCLRIDPKTYLYPLINSWPIISKTSETLIVRRENDSIVFLNELKFRMNSALNLRISINRKEILAVKAVLGEKGVVEGIDYKGDEVIGYVCSIPNTPWFMVSRVDKAEVFIPLKDELITTIGFISLFLIGSGLGLGLFWREQRLKYFKEKSIMADALQVSRDSLNDAQAIAHLGNWEWNILKDEIKGSDEFYRLFDTNYNELIRLEQFLGRMHPDDIERVNNEIVNSVKMGFLYNVDFRVKLSSGGWRDINGKGKVIKDSDGKTIGMVGTSMDITAIKAETEINRKQSEQMSLLFKAIQQLSKTLDMNEIYEAILKFMSENTPNDGFAISEYDPETQLITCKAYWMGNKWLDVSSFPSIPLEEEGCGTQSIAIRTGQSLLIKDFQEQVKTSRSNYYINNETNEIETEISSEEEDITRSAMIVPLKHGNRVTGVIQVMSFRLNTYTEKHLKLLEALAVHIVFAKQNSLLYSRLKVELNERKMAEEKIIEAQRILNRVINLLPIRVFWKDKDLKYLGCNKMFALDAGKKNPEELLGKDDYQMGWKDHAELYRTDDRNVIVSGVPKLDFEELQTTPKGEQIWLKTSKVPLIDLYGNTIGILGSYEDITERKMAELELKEKMYALERFQKLTVGRELAMIELKKEINEIMKNKGEAVKYIINE